LALVI
jgi:glyceraldehyde 3-phosphate dehydrogenase (phosphorylating)